MCIFCKIIEGEIPNKTVLENDNFLAFEDINPQAKVHVLIIPKVHIQSFNEMTPNIMAEMTTFIQEVALTLGVKSDGYRLITNIGQNGGQEVGHIHFHLLAGEQLGGIISK
jgi:histidine triad (HIT) family protein